MDKLATTEGGDVCSVLHEKKLARAETPPDDDNTI